MEVSPVLSVRLKVIDPAVTARAIRAIPMLRKNPVSKAVGGPELIMFFLCGFRKTTSRLLHGLLLNKILLSWVINALRAERFPKHLILGTKGASGFSSNERN